MTVAGTPSERPGRRPSGDQGTRCTSRRGAAGFAVIGDGRLAPWKPGRGESGRGGRATRQGGSSRFRSPCRCTGCPTARPGKSGPNGRASGDLRGVVYGDAETSLHVLTSALPGPALRSLLPPGARPTAVPVFVGGEVVIFDGLESADGWAARAEFASVCVCVIGVDSPCQRPSPRRGRRHQSERACRLARNLLSYGGG